MIRDDEREQSYCQANQGRLTLAQREEVDRIEAEMRIILREAESDTGQSNSARIPGDEAITNERVFIRRFGFDWPEHDRIALLDLKHRLDLTDREIRLLKWTGNLKRKHGVVTVTSTRAAAIYGRCLIMVVALEFALVALAEAVQAPHALSALQVGKLYAAAGIVLLVAWVIYQGYVRPWIIRKRTSTAVSCRPDHAGTHASTPDLQVMRNATHSKIHDPEDE